MRRTRAAGFVTLIWLAELSSAAAQPDISIQRAALKEIRETAADICYTVEQRGRKSEAQLTGEVQAKVTGIVSKIADLGIKGSGQISSQEYQGVSQEALGAALTASANCRERVFNKLVDKILSSPSGKASPPAPRSGPVGAATNTAGSTFPDTVRTKFRTTGSKVMSGGWTGDAILTFSIENQGADAWVGLRETGTSGPCAGARIAAGLPVVDEGRFASLRANPTEGEALAFLSAGGRAIATMSFQEPYCWSKLKHMTTVPATILLVVVRGHEVLSMPLSADSVVVLNTP